MRRKKFNIQFKNKYVGILLVVLIMSIGFAAVSSTLNFKGRVKISVNLEDLDCYIGNLFVDSVNKFDSLSNDLSGFNFSVSAKSAEIKYYIANNSTQYDVKPTITCSDANESGLSLTNAIDEVVEAQKISEGIITITRENTSEVNFTCTLTYELVERTTIESKVKKVFYSADGSTLTSPYKIYTDETNYVDLISPVKSSTVFLGWKNQDDNSVDENTLITSSSDEVLYAEWSLLHARYVSYDPSKGYTDCETVQCALDELAEKLG